MIDLPPNAPPHDVMVKELQEAGWKAAIAPHVWKSPGGKLFSGLTGAWRAMKSSPPPLPPMSPSMAMTGAQAELTRLRNIIQACRYLLTQEAFNDLMDSFTLVCGRVRHLNDVSEALWLSSPGYQEALHTPNAVDDKHTRDSQPRYSQYELDAATKPLHAEIERLKQLVPVCHCNIETGDLISLQKTCPVHGVKP